MGNPLQKLLDYAEANPDVFPSLARLQEVNARSGFPMVGAQVKSFYKEIGPSAGEKAFRQLALEKFNAVGLVVLNPEKEFDSSLFEGVGLFKSGKAEVKIGMAAEPSFRKILSRLFYDAAEPPALSEYEDDEMSLPPDLENFFSELDDECTEEFEKVNSSAFLSVVYLKLDYKNTKDFLRMSNPKFDKRLEYLSYNETFLGPKSVWLNEADLRNK